MTATRPSVPPGRFVSVTLPASAWSRHDELLARQTPASSSGFLTGPRERRGPGHPFGPESVPSATGSASVVYWVPGPLPGPTPPEQTPASWHSYAGTAD